jgi:hypothetical protein
MRIRKALLQTTMLVGVVGASFLSARDARAGDSVFAPNYAAVDGVNGRVEALGGSLAHMSYYGSRGSLSLPLNGPFGVQFDGKLASLGGRTLGKIGTHLFWRNPAQGLLGIYASYVHWNQFGGVHAVHVGGEGEYYWGRWTLQGVAGVEFGNSSSNILTSTSIVPPNGNTPGTISTSTLIDGYDIKTRFFDQINLKYYWTDNWDTYIGHRYFGGKNALALGTEAALPIGLGGGRMASAFVEGRIGSGNYQGVWGGLKFYFGQTDKTLIRRHREDDPPPVDDIFGIVNNFNQQLLQAIQQFCNNGPPIDGSCEAAN